VSRLPKRSSATTFVDKSFWLLLSGQSAELLPTIELAVIWSKANASSFE
jgi:hypothetical protein